MNIKEYLEHHKKSIILYTIIVVVIAGIALLIEMKAEEKAEQVTIKSPIKKSIKLETIGEQISPFVKKSDFFSIENKTNVKLPFISYHDKFMISSKLYNSEENLQLNIEGDIKVNDKQLKNQQLKTIKVSPDLRKTIVDIKRLVNVKECARVTAKNIFVYIDKGISLTFRAKNDFIKFNVLDNKIFVWQERQTEELENKYLLCNYNAGELYDKLSEYVQKLKAQE